LSKIDLTQYLEDDHVKVFLRERERLNRKARQILELLKDRRWHKNVELAKITIRYSARIHELREAGFIIEKAYLGDGIWVYRLVR